MNCLNIKIYPSKELHNHSSNVSNWFRNWYLIRFDQSAGSSQRVNRTPHRPKEKQFVKTTSVVTARQYIFSKLLSFFLSCIFLFCFLTYRQAPGPLKFHHHKREEKKKKKKKKWQYKNDFFFRFFCCTWVHSQIH